MENRKKKDLLLKGESNDPDYQYPEGADAEGKMHKNPRGRRALL
jgi:hypothetical protein